MQETGQVVRHVDQIFRSSAGMADKSDLCRNWKEERRVIARREPLSLMRWRERDGKRKV